MSLHPVTESSTHSIDAHGIADAQMIGYDRRRQKRKKRAGRSLLVSLSGEPVKLDLLAVETPGFRHTESGVDRQLVKSGIGQINFNDQIGR